MFRWWKVTPVAVLLIGCSSHTPDAYQADRSPEARNSYNGISGIVQWQKDQSYLASKELDDKCEQIKTRIVEARLTNNTDLAEQLLLESKAVCIGQ